MKNPILTLADLENFDPQSPPNSGERRFSCPFCGDAKPKDAAHRSLSVNSSNGLYHCNRCKSKGRLREHWPEKSAFGKGQVAARKLARAFEIAPLAQVRAEEKTDWRAIWEAAQPLNEPARGHAVALAYLEKRAIPLALAQSCEVRFVARWHGRNALVFPFKDEQGEVVAVAGRCFGNGGLDKPASGPKKLGAFWASAGRFGPLDATLPAVIVCEAPFDALSMAMCGFPALAFGGTSAPAWLTRKLAFRRVMLAFDADDAGDAASEKIGALLGSFGARCQRLRPERGKDWNEELQTRGEADLGCFLASRVLV